MTPPLYESMVNQTMNVQDRIQSKLRAGLDPRHLEVVNESHRHNVPPGSESHFKVVLVSQEFEGKSLLERHRLVHALLADEMRSEIHALALHTYTEEDWQSHLQSAPASPPCHAVARKAPSRGCFVLRVGLKRG